MVPPRSRICSPEGWPESVSHCARPTRGVRDRALREHRRPIRPPSPILLVVTRAGSLYNPGPASRWTDCTTQPCEHTDFSPLTDTLAHPRLAVSLSVVTYIDRVNISVTARQMMPVYGMTDQQMGWVFSDFVIGYALFQIPGR